MRRGNPTALTSVAVLGVLLLVACGADTTEPGGPESAEVDALIASGWAAYEAGDYAVSLARFDDAVRREPGAAEPYLGRGFALLRRGRETEALATFVTSLGIDPASADTHAGRALAAAALELHALSLEEAGLVLDAAPDYAFAHDARLTARALHRLRAQLYLRTGAYSASAAELDRLEPGSAPHTAEPMALLAALAALGGAVTP